MAVVILIAVGGLIYIDRNVEKIAEDTERDFFMSGAQALEYGIVDKVVADRSELEEESEEASKES